MGRTQQSRGNGGSATGTHSSRSESSETAPKPTSPDTYATVDEAITGLSKRLGLEVDAHFVTSFFAKDQRGALDLPPKPRVDRNLCKTIADLIKPVNVSARDEQAIGDFLKETFRVAAERRLSSYELQLLEFAAQNKNTIEFQFDYRSNNHAHERPLSGDRRVVFGGRHHMFDREYTPQEAWSTFLHEIAHSREAAYGLISRNYATGVVLSEVKANIYGALGDIGLGIKETAKLYPEHWGEVSANMPGFKSLTPLEQYRYLEILCKGDHPPTIAFPYQSAELKEAFPKLTTLIDQRHQTLLELQEKNIPVIDDHDFDDNH
jgi:hypothetical protein